MANKRYALVGLIGKENRCINTIFLDYKEEYNDNIYFTNNNYCKKEDLGLLKTETNAPDNYYVYTEIENVNDYQYKLMEILQEEYREQVEELESKIKRLEESKEKIKIYKEQN